MSLTESTMPSKTSRQLSIESLETKRLLAGDLVTTEDPGSLPNGFDNVPCADITGDGQVNFADFLVLSTNFNSMASFEQGDIDGDGKVTFSDLLWLASQFDAVTNVESEIYSLASRYLESTDVEERNELATRLAQHSSNIDSIITKLEADAPQNLETRSGEFRAEPFTKPELVETYQSDRVFYFVPDSYDPSQPAGLLLFMHGGGNDTPIEYARVSISLPEDDPFSYGLRPHIAESQFIIAAPTAPMNPSSSARWNLPETDDYIDAVIQEAHFRFNIDSDGVFLGGSSMGGFGAYDLCQRLSDRIAGCIPASGSWGTADWRSMIGTPTFIIHATNDAVPPGTAGSSSRPRFTDWFYAERAHELMVEAGVSSVLAGHEGGHNIRNSGKLDELVDWMEDQQRDPYFPKVVALSKRSWRTTNSTTETLDNRWVSILETTPGTIAYDFVKLTGSGRKHGQQRLRSSHRKCQQVLTMAAPGNGRLLTPRHGYHRRQCPTIRNSGFTSGRVTQLRTPQRLGPNLSLRAADQRA
jgi:predicted esterase